MKNYLFKTREKFKSYAKLCEYKSGSLSHVTSIMRKKMRLAIFVNLEVTKIESIDFREFPEFL
jgi:hypothetical protein